MPTDKDWSEVGKALRDLLDRIEQSIQFVRDHKHLIRERDYTFEGCATGETE